MGEAAGDSVSVAVAASAVGLAAETAAVGEPPWTVAGVAVATVTVGGTAVAVGDSSSSPQAVSVTSKRALHQQSWQKRRSPSRRGITSPIPTAGPRNGFAACVRRVVQAPLTVSSP